MLICPSCSEPIPEAEPGDEVQCPACGHKFQRLPFDEVEPVSPAHMRVSAMLRAARRQSPYEDVREG